MKKTFKIQVENKNPDRVVESIKNEVRKYIKREQRKPLPKDTDFWFFDCKFGKSKDEALEIPFSAITKSIDTATSENYEEFYLEIIARAEVKKVKENEEESENIEEEI